MINEPKTIFTTKAQRHNAVGNGLSIVELHTGVRGGNGGSAAANGGCDVSNPAGQGGLRLCGLAAAMATSWCLRVLYVVKMFVLCDHNKPFGNWTGAIILRSGGECKYLYWHLASGIFACKTCVWRGPVGRYPRPPEDYRTGWPPKKMELQAADQPISVLPEKLTDSQARRR